MAYEVDFPVPESLREYFELNQRADELEEDGQFIAAEQLYPQIVDAWESAPLMDRFRVSWESLKKSWRERHDHSW